MPFNALYPNFPVPVMPAKLTVRLDPELIEVAKAYAERQGTSISQLVADYFRALAPETNTASDQDWQAKLSPWTRSLVGLAAGSNRDEDAYRRYLEEKHG